MRAVAVKDENGLLADGITPKSAEAFAEYVSEKVEFGSNQRASSEYRKKSVKRSLKEPFLQ